MGRSVRHKLSTTAKHAHRGFLHGFTSLTALNDIPRPLALVALCSFCMAFPLLVGLLTDHLEYGLTACIGALLGLYSPSFTPHHRTYALLKMLAPFAAAYGFGLFTQHHLPWSSFSLGLVALIATYLALWKQMRPPAGFFFIMICCLSKTHHVEFESIPFTIGAFLGGSLFAISAVFLHDLVLSGPKPDKPQQTVLPFWQPAIFTKAIVAGLTIGGSYYLTSLIGIDNPYWVPITVAAILQGQRMTDFWQRSLHRAIGTALGMMLATSIFALSPTPLILILLLFVLAFTVEVVITKNYALACVFITPLTVILAHTAPIGYSAESLIIARMTDVLIGAGFALLAGMMLKLLPVNTAER